jgi:hypothetical protein
VIEKANVLLRQWSVLSLQSTLSLKSGDQVWVQMDVTSWSYMYDSSDHLTHFTGFMLDEEIVESLWEFFVFNTSKSAKWESTNTDSQIHFLNRKIRGIVKGKEENEFYSFNFGMGYSLQNFCLLFSSSYNGLKNQSLLCLRMGFFFYCMRMAFVVEYLCRKIHGFYHGITVLHGFVTGFLLQK